MRRWLAAVLALLASALTGAGAAAAGGGDGPAAGVGRWAWLADTYWYVPTEYLPAVQLDAATSEVGRVRDQTVYRIEAYQLGYFWGWTAVQLDAGGTGPVKPLCFRLVGSVTPEGDLNLSFTPVAVPTEPTIGVGTMHPQRGAWAMELQMSSGLRNQITHWARMQRCRPGWPCWSALPGVGVPLPIFLAPCLPRTP